MAVRCSNAILALGLLILFQHGERSLGKSVNGCFSRCIKEEQKTKDCLKSCYSMKRRSLNQDYCDFEDYDMYADDPSEALGIAPVHVEYELDKSGKTYKWVNVSWILPDVPKVNSGDNSTKIADVQGFFVNWRSSEELNGKCRKLPKDARYVILNSSEIPSEMMNCDASLYLAVLILPLPEGSYQLKPFNCPPKSKNVTGPYYVRWSFDTDTPTFETVTVETQAPVTVESQAPVSVSEASSSQRPSLIPQEISKDLQSDSSPCQSDACKYVVVGSVIAVVAVIVISIIFLVRRRRKCSDNAIGFKNETIEDIGISNKDFCYVSYFSEDGEAGNLSKSVINFLMANGIKTVAVNVLAKTDLHNYYSLGPRKFSEIYMQEASYVIVLVTKKYLDLCNINLNVQLDKERRRVFEEIMYIDRAQFEFKKGKAVTGSEEKTSSPKVFQGLSINGLASSFKDKPPPRKMYITFIFEPLSSLNLPTWMKGWPIYNWPKDKSEFLHYIGQQG